MGKFLFEKLRALKCWKDWWWTFDVCWFFSKKHGDGYGVKFLFNYHEFLAWWNSVSDQRRNLWAFAFSVNLSCLWVFKFSKTKSSTSEYLILGQNHSALSQSPAITSSLDHDARTLYKVIISTFLTKIYSNKHLNSCWGEVFTGVEQD